MSNNRASLFADLTLGEPEMDVLRCQDDQLYYSSEPTPSDYMDGVASWVAWHRKSGHAAQPDLAQIAPFYDK